MADSNRAPSFRQITVHVDLAPGERRAALKAHKTKAGITKHAEELLKEHFHKPLAEAAAKAEAEETARKKKATEDRAEATAKRQADRAAEAADRKAKREAAKRQKLVEKTAAALAALSKEEAAAALAPPIWPCSSVRLER